MDFFLNFKSIRHHYDSYLQFFIILSRKREQIKRTAFINPPRVNDNKDPAYLQPPFPRISNYTCINSYNKVHVLPHYKRIKTFDLLVCKPILQWPAMFTDIILFNTNININVDLHKCVRCQIRIYVLPICHEYKHFSDNCVFLHYHFGAYW
jgi:hypothetical protein